MILLTGLTAFGARFAFGKHSHEWPSRGGFICNSELNQLCVHFVSVTIHAAMVSRSVVELQQLLEHR
jgi:hypothetical protein